LCLISSAQIEVLPERSPASVSGWDRSSQWQERTQFDRLLEKLGNLETLQLFLRTCKCGFSGRTGLQFCMGGRQSRVDEVGVGISR